ncbi:MAG TPA: peptide chain release factor N(5)-glutamine methyltransferase [Solirubrobacteraceae bacterium]|jgi:release factor glutamine methyltransferase|nr:peptide chain release factor N(5)-glutamine methyltransferase [Solirubrobacteraceae bacterium]
MPPSPVRPLASGTSVRDALDGAATALAAAGCETPRLDAELLLAHALGVPRERLYTAAAASAREGEAELTVAGPAVRVFQDFVKRRSVEREPVAYILGCRHFRRLQLTVDRRALIPRPETELLVEVALGLPPGLRVLDVGTGSGAVALALKDERPDLEVTGSDLSEAALQLARANGEQLGLDVHWLSANLLQDVPDRYDAILSNPPYVREGERALLAPEIVRHEPASALFAGEDGLDVIRPLIEQVGMCPSVHLLALEIGAGQAKVVDGLMRAAGFPDVHAERDLAGIERVVVGERP